MKTSLYWYGAGCWDNNPGRVCLILDADRFGAQVAHAAVPVDAGEGLAGAACVFLLIDESPKWVTVDEKYAELITSKPTL